MSEKVTQTRDKEKTRRRLLAAAQELFYGGGICATGVSAVAERAGVTKMTLYAHFSSKDDLVTAYLEDSDRRWQEFLEEKLSGYEDPREKLLAVCDAYREYLTNREIRGCAFVNCAAEFPDSDHPARRVIRSHKAGIRGRLRELAAEAGAEAPETLADRLFVVLEGAYVIGALEGDAGVLDRSRNLCADLVEMGIRDRAKDG
ncbi:MAG: TetR/AcrR family transcriptional regulator [Rubrobacteraceae bacterium]